MPGIRLFHSNRLEVLADRLADVVRHPLRSPLHREILVVQSKGMERWVSMELAKRLGICANTWFPFPNALLDELFARVLEHAPDPSPLDPTIMVWKILRVLPDCLDKPAFEPLENYLRGSRLELKRYQLAEKIAYLFDQYQVFRPDMVRAWDRGEDQDHGWQPLLWRRLAQDGGVPHRADLQRHLLDRLRIGGPDLPELPERIAVFGISALPPFHLQALAALAAYVDVNLFLLNPCREYWADIRSEREIGRITDRVGGLTVTSEDLYLESGNRLLASMGTLGRDFFQLVQEVIEESHESFVEPGEETLLTCLQTDILHLEERTGAPPQSSSAPLPADTVPTPAPSQGITACVRRGDTVTRRRGDWESAAAPSPRVSPSPRLRLKSASLPSRGEGCGESADCSVMIHSCHSPMREVEVLYDYLLAFFESDLELTPRDVLVMTPDINAYAPYIHAVFAAPADPRLRIPYSIADRSIRREGHVSEALLALLDLVDSRFEASAVLNLLEMAPVRRRLGLNEDDLEQIRTWVAGTRIRWGLDQAHRQRLGFGAFGENTWLAGFQRMLLGYAMPGYGRNTFADILPYDEIEGSGAALLGTFLQFCRDLFAAAADLPQPRPLAQWADDLTGLLDQFLDAGGDGEKEMQAVRQALRALASQQQASGLADAVGVDVIRTYLTQRLDTEVMGTGFITGGVTFCAMLPMRSIPCQVIALIGMNDGAFPRQNRAPGFDLMARAPRRGDRSPRDDDRYLFLEALLSARKTLYISYVGQSLQDNSPLPPSVLVSELLDVIQRGFDLPGQSILDQVITHHRLHPFSPRYFGGGGEDRGEEQINKDGQDRRDEGRLFSYSRENLEASRKLQSERQPPSPFFSARLPEPEAEWRTVDIDQLCRFFAHPVRFLLQQRLHILLEDGEGIVEDREAFDLDHLQRYLMKENLLAKKLEHQELAPALQLERAVGRLPHGQVGECRYQFLSREVNTFYLDLEPYLRVPMLPTLTIDLELSGFRLQGRLDSLTESGLVRFRSAKVKARDRLNLWVRHLCLNTGDTPDLPGESTLLGLDGRWRYASMPTAKARAILSQLLDTYWTGLRQPLKFFPQLSYDYARTIQAGKPPETALNTARQAWQGSGSGESHRSGEGEEPYLALCFAAQEPLDEEFMQLAATIFDPLLEHERHF
jgi:exodeoxyribonuclease V gamma subunit